MSQSIKGGVYFYGLSLAELEAFHFYAYDKNEMLTIVYHHSK